MEFQYFKLKKLNSETCRHIGKKMLQWVGWKNKRPVIVITTKHKVSKGYMKPVKNKFPNNSHSLKQEAILYYMKHLSCVDPSDNLGCLLSYEALISWPWSDFSWFISVCILFKINFYWKKKFYGFWTALYWHYFIHITQKGNIN